MRALIGLILAVVVGFLVYKFYFAQVQPEGPGTTATQAISLTGVKNDLNAIAQAERQYQAQNGSYATLDELIGRDGITTDNVAQHLLDITSKASETGHVYTLHAELEGQKWMPIFEQLLQGWSEQGYELVSMRRYLQGFKVADLPRHEVKAGTVEGRSGTLAVQAS